MNPYEVLGLSRSCSNEELTKAYKSLCRKHHPDNGGDPNKFAEINKAYNDIKKGNVTFSFDIKRKKTLHHRGLFEYAVQ